MSAHQELLVFKAPQVRKDRLGQLCFSQQRTVIKVMSALQVRQEFKVRLDHRVPSVQQFFWSAMTAR